MENESIEKVLRAVLQSSKSGISIRSLQAEYRSLCGESLPLKRLGYQTLEDYLKSIPSVVRLDHRMGELMCFARVCDETAHIAELVARQKSSKKPARSWTANSGRRVKPPDPYLPNGVPRFSLKQPSCRPSAGSSSSSSKPSKFHDGSRNSSASGFYRQMKQEMRPFTQVQHRPTAAPPAVKQTDALNRKKQSMEKKKDTEFQQDSRQFGVSQSSPYVAAEVQKNMRQLLKKYSNGLWMSKLSEVYREMFHQELHPQALTDLEKWTHICFLEKAASENRADRVIYPLLLSQLKTLNNPVFVNVLYQDVCVSNVCADGTLYCRLPSPGAFRLTRMLEEIASGISQMTTELLVSQPFIGKFCLARFRGQWARAEITNMFGDMMMEVLFIDFAVPVTVELAGLREIPPPFLKDFGFIPPQAVKCRLAEVDAPGVDWSPEAIVWLREKVLEAESCKVKILKLEESKGDRVAYIHLFVGGDGLEQNSINHQLVQLFQRALSSRGGNLLDAVESQCHPHDDPEAPGAACPPATSRARSEHGRLCGRGVPPGLLCGAAVARPGPPGDSDEEDVSVLPPEGGGRYCHARSDGRRVCRQNKRAMVPRAGKKGPGQRFCLCLRAGLRSTRAGPEEPHPASGGAVQAAALSGGSCTTGRCDPAPVVRGGVHAVQEPRGAARPGGTGGERSGCAGGQR
ncbi:tudor domain-containing protein 7B isoform X2 [Oryzias latipes]|uniref:tudor domain-containing protein 7B isoform X2 n=1 Tax=Oryzias latipes TaxID=8090 RepID=UPI0009D92C38|nr:tudor domain-containing protein 7B isoform X2 [Oryzias latipes]